MNTEIDSLKLKMDEAVENYQKSIKKEKEIFDNEILDIQISRKNWNNLLDNSRELFIERCAAMPEWIKQLNSLVNRNSPII